MSGPAFRFAFSSISSGRTADPPGCWRKAPTPPEIWRPALDDAVGNGPLHAAPCERQGHAIPTQDGDEFRYHIAIWNDGDTPRLSPHHGPGLERPWQDLEG